MIRFYLVLFKISVPLGEVSSYFHLELVWVAVGF